MKTAFIDSHLRCPRCSKRLVTDMGPDDDGAITIGHDCLNCGWHEQAPRTVADARRRSDVPALISMREPLYQQRLAGREIPLRIDDYWPEGDF